MTSRVKTAGSAAIWRDTVGEHIASNCMTVCRGTLGPDLVIPILARYGWAPVGNDEDALGSSEQPLSPVTDDPTDRERRQMRGRQRQPLRLRSLEPRGPCAAPLLWIVVAGCPEIGIVQLEREMQEVSGEEHSLAAGVQENAPVSGGMARRVSQAQAGRDLAVLRTHARSASWR
jgi:hypothetical protein